MENKKRKERSFINWNEHRETKNAHIGTKTVLRVKKCTEVNLFKKSPIASPLISNGLMRNLWVVRIGEQKICGLYTFIIDTGREDKGFIYGRDMVPLLFSQSKEHN